MVKNKNLGFQNAGGSAPLALKGVRPCLLNYFENTFGHQVSTVKFVNFIV